MWTHADKARQTWNMWKRLTWIRRAAVVIAVVAALSHAIVLAVICVIIAAACTRGRKISAVWMRKHFLRADAQLGVSGGRVSGQLSERDSGKMAEVMRRVTNE